MTGFVRLTLPKCKLGFETHSPFVLWQKIASPKRTCQNLENVEYSRTILKLNHHHVLKSRKPSIFNGFE